MTNEKFKDGFLDYRFMCLHYIETNAKLVVSSEQNIFSSSKRASLIQFLP